MPSTSPILKAVKYPGEWHQMMSFADVKMTLGYRLAVLSLFKATSDIERLSVEEIDRLFDQAIREATEKQ